MEFDENQLGICWDRGFVPINYNFGEIEGEFTKIIAVKGPCGHFH